MRATFGTATVKQDKPSEGGKGLPAQPWPQVSGVLVADSRDRVFQGNEPLEDKVYMSLS